MNASYWLGVATPFIGFAAFIVAVRAWFLALRWFADRGLTADIRLKRDVAGISDYALRRDIWWERSWGPFFAGGWYRKQGDYQQAPQVKFTRWVGLGRVSGPCVTGYWLRCIEGE